MRILVLFQNCQMSRGFQRHVLNPVAYESILQMALVQSRCEEGVRHFSGNLGDELRLRFSDWTSRYCIRISLPLSLTTTIIIYAIV
jgi:hypothetical protein